MMKKIVISYTDFFPGEAEELNRLLKRDDIWRVHIRKPGYSTDEVHRLIDAIPPESRQKISIHDHLHLATDCGLGGVHLNSRNNCIPAGWHGMVSRSLHHTDEIGTAAYDYAFLSPIFPSISKPGYSPTLSAEEIKTTINDKIFALGGVTEDRLDELERMGFGGAAFLGSVWRSEIDMDAFGLQFITHPIADHSIGQETEEALAGGCRWVQLRHKNAYTETLIDEGHTVADLCRKAGATFIVNDRVDLVETFGADGVHLGKNDMPVKEARKLLGPKRIIGATANCFEDIVKAWTNGADYIGLGPFRFTTTKVNLSPILGLSGYRKIVDKCHAAGIQLPIVAIGGITVDDVGEVMRTGVDGIAVSSEIINASDPVEKTRALAKIVADNSNTLTLKFRLCEI